ncbi:MAG: outer membrane lipoprotein chaperone LolA [Acidobacteriota bacterium]|nr:outer membrane lipoprotein chaperone LolA [Acidobacteriota bacterium]
MIFISTLLLGLFISLVPSQSAELDQLINGLQAKYNKLSSLSADFTQIYNAPGQKSRRESGHLLLKKPGKMRWDYTAPEAKLFLSDGKWLYEYVAAERYALRSTVKESGDLRAPFAFLLGRGNLRRDFKRIEFSQESPVRAGNKVLRMIPKRAADFKELVIEIEPSSLQLARLTLIESGGARSDFLFSNLRENALVNDAQFIFKAPAGVEVRTEN